ncbi:DUF3947 family protein [Bacillus toyonensis]|uniref:DUF3947 family protein n=1 Tax=Bacillus toyonensis TaxID=155322 RepID=UPI000BEE2005|nr:DUF3947 family protein [Bacillus toyonensis]PEF83287.1 hypothetical protein CON80_06235 [Bacillus toyonensis]
MNYYLNSNRVMAGSITIHSAQPTIHAMQHALLHAMQHALLHAMQQCCPEAIHYYHPTIQYHPIQYIHQSIYPAGFRTTPYD